jgi:hypothetical protein
MKTKRSLKKFRSAIVVLALFLALVSATALQGAQGGAQGPSAAVALQDTPTPQADNYSEIGSTDGIVAMGFAIVAIVVATVFIKRKSWADS